MDMDIDNGHSHAAPTTTTGLDVLVDELLVAILVRLPHANDIGRCTLVSQRFANLIARDPDQFVWKRAAECRAQLIQLDGPWLAFAASTKGWSWIRRALDPWTGCDCTIGFVCNGPYTDLGEYREDGSHGDLISIRNNGGWRFAGPVDDDGMSYAHVFHANGDTYRGQLLGRRRHGHGVYTYAARRDFLSPLRIEGGWVHGMRHGTVTITNGCNCTGPLHGGESEGAHADNPGHLQGSAVQPTLAAHGTDPSRPYGYVATETWSYGAPMGPSTRIYCNGDLYECERDRDTTTTVRMVLSPHCPDPRFRSVEIKSPDWRWTTVERPGDQGSFTLSYPDPASAWSDMFCLYHDYFKAGFLPVEERDRAIIGAILAEAALDLDT
ncbi:Morn repeat protein [Pandoravirus inopinatum]|uniref:Morn repeat protein n=1 Tax=Pandoravirus inopinatum TaxID=1605721 RepID=A0A0B5JCP6_9VIRU|nr:Morn repeat protein [Pandoravirus inopinatum]AJF97427.1 Morn repeat protein [Pandoravirus inopinatum]